MKKLLMIVVGGAIGFAVGYIVVGKHMLARNTAEIAAQQSAWAAERAALESALEQARERPQSITFSQAGTATNVVTAAAKSSPEQIIAHLRTTKLMPGGQTRVMRQIIHDLDELIAAGPDALAAIREFLSKNEELDYTPSTNGRGSRDVPLDFLFPPSLRFALFDVVKQIGGADAEKILGDALTTTSRGGEISWLARALQEIAPDKYREAALIAARGLLDRNADAKPGERDYGFKVLTMFNDASYVANAQAQLIRADGQVDKSAMQYLLQTLGPNAVSLAAQLYDDPRITDPQKKEPFARVALNYVGADATANAFYVKAINDLGLSNEQRKNLIEDLNQDGFSDRKNLSAARDLPLIDNRLALIQQLAPGTTDPVNAAALKEAYKDLVKMRERITQPKVQLQ